MAAIRIVLLSIVAAVLYGIVHDQVTARVAVEYFTVAHPLIIDSEDPTALGLFWGVVATWWVGAILGVLLAVAARVGARPKRSARELVRPIGILLATMAGAALAAGLLGGILGASSAVTLLEPLASQIPAARHARFLGVMWAHLASYGIGGIGGLVLAVLTWRSRSRPGSTAVAGGTTP
jgi:hypothetical protein